MGNDTSKKHPLLRKSHRSLNQRLTGRELVEGTVRGSIRMTKAGGVRTGSQHSVWGRRFKKWNDVDAHQCAWRLCLKERDQHKAAAWTSVKKGWRCRAILAGHAAAIVRIYLARFCHRQPKMVGRSWRTLNWKGADCLGHGNPRDFARYRPRSHSPRVL